MFSKTRNQRSSLKQPPTTDSSSTSKKDRSPVITTASLPINSNLLSPPTNSTSTQPTNQSI